MKAPVHQPPEKRIGDCDHAHALVMSHVCANGDNVRSLGQTRIRIVQRLIPAIAASSADFGQTLEVASGGARIAHRCQCRRVRGDDGVVAESALESEAWYSKARILIGEFQIAGIIGGFGCAPRDAASGAVFDLLFDHLTTGLVEETSGRGPHDQSRHQIFEHRARPGDERRAISNGSHCAPKPEPVARRQVAFGDRDEARETGFRRQQIITIGVEAAVLHPVADRQQFPLHVEEKAELHLVEHASGGLACFDETRTQEARSQRGSFESRDQGAQSGKIAFPVDATGGKLFLPARQHLDCACASVRKVGERWHFAQQRREFVVRPGFGGGRAQRMIGVILVQESHPGN